MVAAAAAAAAAAEAAASSGTSSAAGTGASGNTAAAVRRASVISDAQKTIQMARARVNLLDNVPVFAPLGQDQRDLVAAVCSTLSRQFYVCSLLCCSS
jgi:hypothetical protein